VKTQGSLPQVPIVHHMEEDVGGIRPIGQVTDLIDKCVATHLSTNVKSSVMWSWYAKTL